MTINMPLGNACKNCKRVLNSKNHDPDKFIRAYYQ